MKAFFWECSWGFWAVFGKGGVNSRAVYNSGLLSVPCLSSLSIRTHRDVYQSNKQPGTCTHPDLVCTDKANDFLQLVSFSERTDLAFCLLHGIESIFLCYDEQQKRKWGRKKKLQVPQVSK